MACTTREDLFVYQLGIARDAESSGHHLLEWLSLKVDNDDLVNLLRSRAEDCVQALGNIDGCLQTLGASPLQTPSETVEGIRKRFEVFSSQRCSPPVVNEFALDTAIHYMNFGIGSYRGLLDVAVLLHRGQCAQSLQTNLVHKEEGVTRLERARHEVIGNLAAA